MTKKRNTQRGGQGPMKPRSRPASEWRPLGPRDRQRGVVAKEIRTYTDSLAIIKTEANAHAKGYVLPLAPWTTVLGLSSHYKAFRVVGIEIVMINRRPNTEGAYMFAWLSDPSIVRPGESTDDTQIFNAWSSGVKKTPCVSDCLRVRWTAPNQSWLPLVSTAPTGVVDRTRSAGEIGWGFIGTREGEQVCALYQLSVTVEYRDPVGFADRVADWNLPVGSRLIGPGVNDEDLMESDANHPQFASAEHPQPLQLKGGGILAIEPTVEMNKGHSVYNAYENPGKVVALSLDDFGYDGSFLVPSDGQSTTVMWPTMRYQDKTYQFTYGFETLRDIRLWSVGLDRIATLWDPEEWYPGEYTKVSDVMHTPKMLVSIFSYAKGALTRIGTIKHDGGTGFIHSQPIRGADMWTGSSIVIRVELFTPEDSLRRERVYDWIGSHAHFNPGTIMLSYEELRQ